MDKMDKTLFKTAFAGIFGFGQGWLTILESAQYGQLMSNLLRTASFIVAVLSGIYIVSIQRHRSHIKEIDEARAETKLCQACRLGKPPEICPIAEPHRPSFCPKEKEKKRLMKSRFTKSFLMRMLLGDTTK